MVWHIDRFLIQSEILPCFAILLTSTKVDPYCYYTIIVYLKMIHQRSSFYLKVVLLPWYRSPKLVGYTSQIAKSMGPIWGSPGSCRPQMGPMLAPWSLLSGIALKYMLTPAIYIYRTDSIYRSIHPKNYGKATHFLALCRGQLMVDFTPICHDYVTDNETHAIVIVLIDSAKGLSMNLNK